MDQLRILFGVTCCVLLAVLPARAEPVDMLLCLAADVSESVSESEYALQRMGHAAAVEDPDVVRAISGGLHGRIAISYVEWADQLQQFTGVDWHVVGDQASAAGFAEKIRRSPPPPWIGWTVRNTSIAEVIRFCMRQFRDAPVVGGRMVIDISSDGTNNVGGRIHEARDFAVSNGVVINALAIEDAFDSFPNGTHTRPEGGLANYFRASVVGGPGAFVQSARGYASFGEMIREKFILELASAE
ncbi:DUF1194 domain-containing protein [Hoeflea sp.]|uniref:DUF1194 domain-containing protein n=1 Tax=Hoeflea sp. TaxID=1940281 RepID=UPI003B519014